ncbi:hypothetical protein BJV77DRAFT_984963 [Russula vinacea]|nr:hypothetical protein BJV77DRAFT_984963 [Russula vinacea]
MNLFTSRKQRRVVNQEEERAKARSDEIDLYLKEEGKNSFDVLLMSSCPRLIENHTSATCTEILTALIF